MPQPLIPISTLNPDELIEKEASLFKYDGEDAVVDSSRLRAELSNQKVAGYSFPTGIHRLDAAIGNIEAGELIAIGGPSKNGKTLLAQTITANMASIGTHCLWFTFEVPARQFLAQMPQQSVFYLPRKLKSGNLDWLRDRIMEAKAKFDSRVVFVDNLHHLIDFTTVRNVSLDIGTVIRELKRTAVDLNVALLILCHSRKPEIEPKTGMPKEVSEWDLRDSSFIPQECDSTIMVQRKVDELTKECSAQAIVKVCLHRRTGTMGKKIHVIKTGQLLEEDVQFYEPS